MGNIFAFVIGMVVGSFLGVMIDRFPQGESVISGRSHCGTCKRALKWYELVPVFSQLCLRSRCRTCQVKLPLWYAGLEAVTGSFFLLTWEGRLDLAQGIVGLMSVVLAIFDSQTHDFPFVVWLGFTALVFVMSPFQWTQLIWVGMALLALLMDMKIGAGDFLWMFTASLVLSFIQLIWVIQIACLCGICWYFLTRKKGELAFIPPLGLGYLAVLLLGQIL